MYLYKIHCRDKETHKNAVLYVEIGEQDEKLAAIEAEKSGRYKVRKIYFAGIKDDKRRRKNEVV